MKPSKPWIRSSFPGLHPSSFLLLLPGVGHPSDQGVLQSMFHSPSSRRRRRSVSTHHGRISRHGLDDLDSFLPQSLPSSSNVIVFTCAPFVGGHRAFCLFRSSCRSRLQPVLCFRLYLSPSGSLIVMSSSRLGIQAPGHFTLRSRSASWHFHTSNSYHHLPSSRTAHSSSTSAAELCTWSCKG